MASHIIKAVDKITARFSPKYVAVNNLKGELGKQFFYFGDGKEREFSAVEHVISNLQVTKGPYFVGGDVSSIYYEAVSPRNPGFRETVIMEGNPLVNLFTALDFQYGIPDDRPSQPFGTDTRPYLIPSFFQDRIIACTGSYLDPHEPMYFQLRAGKPQRCVCCAQVFKLVMPRMFLILSPNENDNIMLNTFYGGPFETISLAEAKEKWENTKLEVKQNFEEYTEIRKVYEYPFDAEKEWDELENRMDNLSQQDIDALKEVVEKGDSVLSGEGEFVKQFIAKNPFNVEVP